MKIRKEKKEEKNPKRLHHGENKWQFGGQRKQEWQKGGEIQSHSNPDFWVYDITKLDGSSNRWAKKE